MKLSVEGMNVARGASTAFEKLMSFTVLIVDDEGTTRDLCRVVIAESGLLTRTASTTEEALEALEQYPSDIVITDLRVPELGGFRTAEARSFEVPRNVRLLDVAQENRVLREQLRIRTGFAGLIGLSPKIPPWSRRSASTTIPY